MDIGDTRRCNLWNLNKQIDSVDWFAFERTLLYVLVRHLRPSSSLETGVFYGGDTAFLLAALVWIGIAKLDHGDNSVPAFTGLSPDSSSRMGFEETVQ
jgi:hypothetical protein